jgi:hypothetical protein
MAWRGSKSDPQQEADRQVARARRLAHSFRKDRTPQPGGFLAGGDPELSTQLADVLTLAMLHAFVESHVG